MQDQELIMRAREARKNAYIPYSHFAVGAALECAGGEVFTGCNIENATYTPTNCAERTAFFKAVSEGHLRFEKIAIVGGYAGEKGADMEDETDECPPCGVCRQVMAEFCDPETFQILLAKNTGEYRSFLLKELLPQNFGPGNLMK